ncbi:unnamed protein product [Amoebophrya sp. A120]|nr:unnamed protein product [Amoebophrya sp. A120]|eukprot:GSA120T00010441001.1
MTTVSDYANSNNHFVDEKGNKTQEEPHIKRRKLSVSETMLVFSELQRQPHGEGKLQGVGSSQERDATSGGDEAFELSNMAEDESTSFSEVEEDAPASDWQPSAASDGESEDNNEFTLYRGRKQQKRQREKEKARVNSSLKLQALWGCSDAPQAQATQDPLLPTREWSGMILDDDLLATPKVGKNREQQQITCAGGVLCSEEGSFAEAFTFGLFTASRFLENSFVLLDVASITEAEVDPHGLGMGAHSMMNHHELSKDDKILSLAPPECVRDPNHFCPARKCLRYLDLQARRLPNPVLKSEHVGNEMGFAWQRLCRLCPVFDLPDMFLAHTSPSRNSAKERRSCEPASTSKKFDRMVYWTCHTNEVENKYCKYLDLHFVLHFGPEGKSATPSSTDVQCRFSLQSVFLTVRCPLQGELHQRRMQRQRILNAEEGWRYYCETHMEKDDCCITARECLLRFLSGQSCEPCAHPHPSEVVDGWADKISFGIASIELRAQGHYTLLQVVEQTKQKTHLSEHAMPAEDLNPTERSPSQILNLDCNDLRLISITPRSLHGQHVQASNSQENSENRSG